MRKERCFFKQTSTTRFTYDIKRKRSSGSISRVLYNGFEKHKTSVFVIYLIRMSPHGLSILPSIGVNRTGNPQTMVYMNLQPPDDTARRSPDDWWSLTPPSHPYHPSFVLDNIVKTRILALLSKDGGCFLLSYPTVANSFHFQKRSTLCCPDFPLVARCYQRQSRDAAFFSMQSYK